MRLSTTLQTASLALALTCFAAAQCDPRLDTTGLGPLHRFGFASAVSGDWGFVGAQGDDTIAYNAGAVHTYEFIAGAWIPRQRLLASDGLERDLFGGAVAADGKVLIVGAPSNHATAYRTGAAYVFERVGSSYVEVQKIAASDGQDKDEFGFAVAIDGDRLIVGARYGDAPGAVDSGAAYVFERSAGQWTEVAKLVASDAAPIDYYGRAVDIEGDVAVVGAWGNDDNGTGTGAAYVYRASAGWSEDQKLLASDGAVVDYFGYSVAVEDEVVAVGAPGWDGNLTDQGAVYVFRHGGNWAQDQYLPGVHDGGQFGYAVAMDDGQMVATAVTGAGLSAWVGDAAYLTDNGNSFAFTGRLLAYDGATDDRFGASVALDDGRVIIGAEGDDDDGSYSGACYGFDLPFADTNLDGLPDDCNVGLQAFCACAPGPCGNNSLVGCVNSTGVGAVLDRESGGLSVSADDLVLRASDMPTSQFGLVFMGGVEVPAVGLADGQRCIGGTLFRFPVASTGGAGRFDTGPGLVGHANGTFPVQGHVLAGQTWLFQAWYRDPGGACGLGSNVTNGLAVTFEL
ncbi:MAG: FG-GAP repeat protein [Planctomycetota bacterium]|nr:FG-GAP repeat protein [Planctomycetota bacterium]